MHESSNNISAVDSGNPQDQQDRDVRRNMKYERDTAVAEMVLGAHLDSVTACILTFPAPIHTGGSCATSAYRDHTYALNAAGSSGSCLTGLTRPSDCMACHQSAKLCRDYPGLNSDWSVFHAQLVN